MAIGVGGVLFPQVRTAGVGRRGGARGDDDEREGGQHQHGTQHTTGVDLEGGGSHISQS